MTETPKYLELYLEHTEDGEDSAVFGCPVAPCQCIFKVTAPGLTKGFSPVLRLGDSLGDPAHPDPAARAALADAEADVLSHIELDHDWSAWLIAMQISDDVWEKYLEEARTENERAWANVRSGQADLMTVRQELADLKLASSHQEGALASVREIAAHMQGMMISPDLVTGSVAALFQIVGSGHDDAVPTYVQAVRRLCALEDAKAAILRYLDLFDDTAEGTRRTVQAFLGVMPHQSDRTAAALAELRQTVDEMRFTTDTPPQAARLWEAAKALLEQVDRPARPGTAEAGIIMSE